jgi:hypothetical protein
MQEHWLPVVGWEGLYEVSDWGRVRSVPHVMTRSNGYPFTVRSTVLRPNRKQNHSDHQMVHLSRDAAGSRVAMLVHRAVLEAFVGPCPTGQECCHNDGNAANNRLENLRWDTHKANGEDAMRHRTHCHNGHEYTPENSRFESGGQRRCITCLRENGRRRSRRKSLARKVMV